jgi:hypothetical protein
MGNSEVAGLTSFWQHAGGFFAGIKGAVDSPNFKLRFGYVRTYRHPRHPPAVDFPQRP